MSSNSRRLDSRDGPTRLRVRWVNNECGVARCGSRHERAWDPRRTAARRDRRAESDRGMTGTLNAAGTPLDEAPLAAETTPRPPRRISALREFRGDRERERRFSCWRQQSPRSCGQTHRGRRPTSGSGRPSSACAQVRTSLSSMPATGSTMGSWRCSFSWQAWRSGGSSTWASYESGAAWPRLCSPPWVAWPCPHSSTSQ
jgi:hypothetical protein